MVRRGFTPTDHTLKTHTPGSPLRGPPGSHSQTGWPHLCLPGDLIPQVDFACTHGWLSPIQIMLSDPRPALEAQTGPVIPAQPSLRDGSALAHSSLPKSCGPGCAGPHPCSSRMPTVPMFVQVSKPMLPTPKSPSANMGFLLKAP